MKDDMFPFASISPQSYQAVLCHWQDVTRYSLITPKSNALQ